MTDQTYENRVVDPVVHREVRYRTVRPALPLTDEAGNTSAVLAVCVNGQDRAVFGSAFMVGPGIALTANHVIEEYRLRGRMPEESMVLLGTRDDELQIWGVRSISMHEGADVAILLVEQRFEPLGDLVVDVVALTTRCPARGEPVAAMGYSAKAEGFAVGGSIDATRQLATGTAGDFFASRAPMSPGPSFQSDLVIVGGMSGGPIFDKNGRVPALCGTSMPPDDVYPAYTSFGQLLWQVLVEEVQGLWPIGYHHGAMRLLSLADEADRIDVVPTGVTYRW